MLLHGENPPWVDAVLKKACESLHLTMNRMGLPMPTGYEDTCKVEEELGCGSYGCVYTTDDPNVVFKITSDESEAWFVQTAMSLFPADKWPSGLVQYYGIFFVPGARFRGRKVYALWRRSASDVGKFRIKAQSDHAFSEAQSDLALYLVTAQRIRDVPKDRLKRVNFSLLKESADDVRSDLYDRMSMGTKLDYLASVLDTSHPQFFPTMIAIIQIAIESMQQNSLVYFIGDVLSDLFDAGIVLADLHNGNIGRVQYEGHSKPSWVITDPGHAVLLNQKLSAVHVPEPLHMYNPGRLDI